MTWAQLHNGDTVYGKRTGSIDNLGGNQGLPVRAVLSQMVQKAQGLPLTAVNQGMAFTYARAVVAGEVVSVANKVETTDTQNKSAMICHEDRVFPVNPGGGIMLIRQSMAPCTRCRAAFRAWARQRQAAIIVSADKGYDLSPDNTVFIFAETGAVWRWE